MDQFNDKYELENARFQTTADEIKPYKNICILRKFSSNNDFLNNLQKIIFK